MEKKDFDIELKMVAQFLDYETFQCYFPERWEMPRHGKLLYSDDELQNALKLIVFNLGVKKSLDVIPGTLIKEYVEELKK